MKTEDKTAELVSGLIRATEEGQVNWHPTARIDEFTCSLQGRFTILLSKDKGEISLRMLDTDDRELLSISESRARMLGLPWPSGQLKVDVWSAFFDVVRRNALHVDQAIDEVLRGLKRA